MLEFESSEPEWVDTTLLPETRVTHGQEPPTEPIRGWASVGRPVVLPIALKRVESTEFRQLDAGSNNERFFLVQLACSFRAPDDEPFEDAWLTIDLQRADAQEPLPVAWSMDPLVLQDNETITEKLKVGVDLKIAPVSASTGGEEQRTGQRAAVHVTALNELQSNPVWEFTRTHVRAISGVYKLRLIARVPAKAVCVGRVQLRSSVRRRRLLWSYDAEFPSAEPMAFSLS